MEKVKPVEVNEICPQCGSVLVERTGKFGKFIACSNYPKCKYIKKEEKEIIIHPTLKCEKCGGDLIQRVATKGKNKGKKFYSCQNYPKCTHILNEKAE
jgi:DNA topoisomerase-1